MQSLLAVAHKLERKSQHSKKRGVPVIQNRTRKNLINFRVSDEEIQLITEKMAVAGIHNKESYLRKMALDGYVIRIDFADVRELSRLLRNATNNLNQVAKRANETRSIYSSDIQDLQDHYEKLWVSAESIMKKLANL